MPGIVTPETEGLFGRLRRGDPEAWIELHSRWARALSCWLSPAFPRVPRDNIGTVVEEVLEDLCLRSEEFSGAREAWPWARKTARLRLLEEVQRPGRLSLSLSLSLSLEPADPSGEAFLGEIQTADTVVAFERTLDEESCRIFRALRLEGTNRRGLCADLHLNRRTLDRRIKLLRERFRSWFDLQGG